ncbi:MAG: FAD-dependent oxidoreductase [Patescibacteria group bacterium]
MKSVERVEMPDVFKKPIFKITTAKDEFLGKTLVVATGTEHKKMGVPGEGELSAKGVSYCALCDGAFFKEKEVALVGGGDTAAIDGLILTEFVGKIHVLVRRDVMRAEPINLEKLTNHPKVQIHYKTEVSEILGKEHVEGVRLKSGEILPVSAVFVAIGHVPNSGVAKDIGVELDSHGYIKVDVGSQTNIPGVYAAGDVTDKPFKQAIIGASEGVMASYFAYQYLQES